MEDKNKQVDEKLHTNKKYRTSSAILCLNKDYIKSASGLEEATESEIRALQAIISILIPFDPMASLIPEHQTGVSRTESTMQGQPLCKGLR